MSTSDVPEVVPRLTCASSRERFSLAAAQDGRLALFGANKDGLLFHREQPSLGSTSWSPWTRSATKGWLSVGAEPNADGRLALLGVTPSGELWARQEATPNSNRYYNWTRLSTVTSSGLSVGPLGRVSMAYNRSNRLEIFATNQLGQAFYRSQLAPGSRQWTAWNPFSFSGRLRSIAVTTYTDGRIELLGVDDAGRVWCTTQNTPTDNNWLPFSQLGGFGATAIAAARNADGRLELFAVDAGGGAWHRQQTAVGTWGGTWVPLSPRTLSRMTAETDAAGRVHLVGVDNLGVIWQSVQTSANANTYSPWTQLDGRLRP